MRHETLMRRTTTMLVASVAILSPACSTLDFITDNCDSESLTVTWPATIVRGTSTTNVTLTGSVSPGNIDPGQFKLLRQLLVTDDQDITTNVVWTVSAFDVNGGNIAFQHSAPLSSGQIQPVNFAFDGGGWGVVPSARPLDPIIAVRSDNFRATSASGSITAITGLPLKLRIDVTTGNPTGENIRLTGDAQFDYQKTSSSCS